MIILRGHDLIVRLDPEHGGEILDLIDSRTGRQLLGRPPFAAADRAAGDLDEDTWTAAYRGGWQLLAPNAGNACGVDGLQHGFHGRASVDPWTVVDTSPSGALLEWSGHDLRVRRSVAIDEGGLSLVTTFEALEGRVPLISVEHCSVGLDVLDPEVELRLPSGRAYELSEELGPVLPPADAPTWPEVALLDGTVERGERLSLRAPRARFHVVADLPHGRAELVNASTGVGLALEWDTGVLPHLWVWHEARVSPGLWRERGEILAVEPASVPHSLGLAAAIENDQAHWVEPGSPLVQRVHAHPLRPKGGTR
jgi:hypothetical protein